MNIRHTYVPPPLVKARNPQDLRNQTVLTNPGTLDDQNPSDIRKEQDTTLAASLGNNTMSK